MKSKAKNASGQPGTKKHDVNATGRRTEKRPAASLRPYPRQTELFSDLRENEFLALVEDIRLNGMKHPPEILPDGTILTGHQRVKAARELGWKEIDVVVRGDLQDADEATIFEAFVEDNLHRRHLSKLQQAKCAIELANVECERQNFLFDWQRHALVVKRVSERLGAGDKNARRYIAVSKTPLPIQEAFERKLLTLVAAAGIGNLRQEVQHKLAESIGKLLAQTDAKGTAAIKKKMRLIVQGTFQKNRKQKWVPAPSPADTLDACKACLDAHLEVIQQTKQAIIADLRGDEFSREMKSSALFQSTISLRHRVVRELKDQCNSLSQVVDQISQEIESDALDTFSDEDGGIADDD
jgi:hypothetical protein